MVFRLDLALVGTTHALLHPVGSRVASKRRHSWDAKSWVTTPRVNVARAELLPQFLHESLSSSRGTSRTAWLFPTWPSS